MATGALLLLAAALAQGCTDRAKLELDLTGATFDYGWAVLQDAAGAATRSTEVFGLAGGAIAFGSLPQLELTPEERSILVIGIARADLERDLPSFDAARASEIRVGEAQSCAGGAYASDGRSATVSIPPGAQVLGGSLDGPLVLAPVARPDSLMGRTLSVPIELERCRLDRPEARLVPYGAEESLLPSGTRIAGRMSRSGEYLNLVRIAPLGDGRLLGLAATAIYLFERGGRYRDAPTHVIDRATLPLARVPAFRGIAVQPLGRSSERRAVVVAGDEALGAMVEVRIGPEGFRSARTATVTRARLSDVIFDDSGTLVAVGEDGVILTQTSSSAPLDVVSLGDAFDLARVVASGDSAAPHLISTRAGEVLEGDAVLNPARLVKYALSTLAVGARYLGALTAVRAPSGVERWAGTINGHLFRRGAGEEQWSTITVEAPPSFAPCASSENACGHRTITTAGYSDLVAIPRTARSTAGVGIVLSSCSALVVTRVGDRCATPLVPGGGAVEQSQAGIVTAVVVDGRLYTGGPFGSVSVADLRGE